MVYKPKSPANNFLFDEMPVDNIIYDRKGGCFVTTKKVLAIFIVTIFIVILVGVFIFYSTKKAYEHKKIPNSLTEFLDQYIDEDKKPSKPIQFVPKHYQLFIHPVFNDTDKPFTFTGTVWITFSPTVDRLKTIELDADDLSIDVEQISVYRSHTLSLNDFPAFEQIDKKRIKRDDDDYNYYDYNTSEMSMETTNATERSSSTSSTTAIPQIYFTDIEDDDSRFYMSNKYVELDDVIELDKVSEPNNEIDVTYLTEVRTNASDIDISSNDSTVINTTEDTDTYPLESVFANETSEIKVIDTDIDMENKKISIKLEHELVHENIYIVKIKFSGKMSKGHGFSYAEYENSDGSQSYFAATLTSPNYTSKIFPCFNNNLFRTPITVSIVRQLHMNTVSNTLLDRSDIMSNYDNNDWIIDSYKSTKPITLDNFGFVVSPLHPTVLNVNENLTIFSYFRPEVLPASAFIESILPSVLNSFEELTGTSFGQRKLNLIGWPTESVETVNEIKAGLIIMNERNFIGHSDMDKIAKAEHLTNEIAKLWLETLVGFNNLDEDQKWLREALPLYLEVEALKEVFVKYDYAKQFLSENRFDSMRMEMSLHNYSLSSYDINEYEKKRYSLVTEYKGLSLLMMLKTVISPSNFDTIFKEYFKKLSNNNEANFHELIQTNMENKTNSKLISELFDSWTEFPKYPVLHVSWNESKITIQQNIFDFENANSSSNCTWTNPISFMEAMSTNFSENDIFWNSSKTLQIDNELLYENDSIIILNPSGFGYYRVNYDEIYWREIINAIHENHQSLPIYTRAVLADDAMNLAKFGYLDFSIPFNIINCWRFSEYDYLPWKVVLDNLEFIYHNSFGINSFEQFNNFLVEVISSAYGKIVLSPINRDETKLKQILTKWACEILNIPSCIKNAQRDYRNMLSTNGTLIISQKSSNDLKILLCTVVKNGGLEEWMTIQKSFSNSDHNYNRILINALGCTRDLNLISIYTNYLQKFDYKKYIFDIFQSIVNNKFLKIYFLEYFSNNFDNVWNVAGYENIYRLMVSLSTQQELSVFEDIYLKHSTNFNEFVNSTRDALHFIKKRLIWRDTIAMNINDVDFNDMICTRNFGDTNARINVFGALGPILRNYTIVS